MFRSVGCIQFFHVLVFGFQEIIQEKELPTPRSQCGQSYFEQYWKLC